MKYNVTYSCGHTGIVDLGGKEKERTSMLAWYERSALCPECYKLKRTQQRFEKLEKKREILSHFKLCELNGSPKQVAWAKKIRNELILNTFDNTNELGRLFIAYLCYTEADARFYIDTRQCKDYIEVLVLHGDLYIENNTVCPKQEILEIIDEMGDEIYVD